jgi:hypothetical protein
MSKTLLPFFFLAAISEFFFESRYYALWFIGLGVFVAYSSHTNKLMSSLEQRIAALESKEEVERFIKRIEQR